MMIFEFKRTIVHMFWKVRSSIFNTNYRLFFFVFMEKHQSVMLPLDWYVETAGPANVNLMFCHGAGGELYDG